MAKRDDEVEYTGGQTTEEEMDMLAAEEYARRMGGYKKIEGEFWDGFKGKKKFDREDAIRDGRDPDAEEEENDSVESAEDSEEGQLKEGIYNQSAQTEFYEPESQTQAGTRRTAAIVAATPEKKAYKKPDSKMKSLHIDINTLPEQHPYRAMEESKELMQLQSPFYNEFQELMKEAENQFYLYRKTVEKEIDIKWIEAIEDSLLSIDTVMRHPRTYIELKEELLPVELSRNITSDSVKYLAQHSNMIQEIRADGTIVPSKMMNYIKEESWQTYENKFINTLIDRLFAFVLKRSEKLFDKTLEESEADFRFETRFTGSSGDQVKMSVAIESIEKVGGNALDGQEAGSLKNARTGEEMSIIERVGRIRGMVGDLKASDFCKKMGNSYIRPPVMRTNAILKNPDYKQCLILWQYIESYGKVGYQINVTETTQKPSTEYMTDMYQLAGMSYAMFKFYTSRKLDDELKLKERTQKKKIKPKFVRHFITAPLHSYDITETGVRHVISIGSGGGLRTRRSESEKQVQAAINRAVTIEKTKREEELRRIEQLKEEERKRKEAVMLRMKLENERREQEEREREEEERKRTERQMIARQQADEEARRMEAEAQKRRKDEAERKLREEQAAILAAKLIREAKEKAMEAERVELRKQHLLQQQAAIMELQEEQQQIREASAAQARELMEERKTALGDVVADKVVVNKRRQMYIETAEEETQRTKATGTIISRKRRKW